MEVAYVVERRILTIYGRKKTCLRYTHGNHPRKMSVVLVHSRVILDESDNRYVKLKVESARYGFVRGGVFHKRA